MNELKNLQRHSYKVLKSNIKAIVYKLNDFIK